VAVLSSGNYQIKSYVIDVFVQKNIEFYEVYQGMILKKLKKVASSFNFLLKVMK